MSSFSMVIRPYCMWILPVTVFAYQFILRLWPGLMMTPIMTQLSINTTEFGFLCSIYYYGYAGMQIPMAILLERLGPRKMISSMTLLLAVSAWIFHYTDSFFVACVSRFLIGLSSAVGFLGASKVVSQWFLPQDYAKMTGLSVALGLIGAVFGGKPLGKAIDLWGGMAVSSLLSCVGITLGLLTFFFLKEPQKLLTSSDGPSFTLKDIKGLISSGPIWLLGLINLLLVGPLEGFADVWGVYYLMKAYGLTRDNAALFPTFMFIGLIIGGPIIAILHKKWGEYTLINGCGIGIIIAFLFLLKPIPYSFYALTCLSFFVGLCCSYQVLVLSIGAHLATSFMGIAVGVPVAFLNCMNMMGGTFFHTVIGSIVEYCWKKQGSIQEAGTPVYSLDAYIKALSMIPLSAVLGVALTFWVSFLLRKKRTIKD